MVIELREECEGNGVDVLGESDVFGADPLAFPFVDHHADILSLRLVLGVRCEYAGINCSGHRRGSSNEKKTRTEEKGGKPLLGWGWIADTIRRGPTPCTYRIMQRNGRATCSGEIIQG